MVKFLDNIRILEIASPQTLVLDGARTEEYTFKSNLCRHEKATK